MNDTRTCEGCGGRQSGPVTYHWASCPVRFGPLPPEPQIRAELVGKIRAVCAKLDARYANAVAGTAERRLCSFHWPLDESTGIPTLCALLDQAREYLRRAPALPTSAGCRSVPRKSRSRSGRTAALRPDRAPKAVE